MLKQDLMLFYRYTRLVRKPSSEKVGTSTFILKKKMYAITGKLLQSPTTDKITHFHIRDAKLAKTTVYLSFLRCYMELS